MRWQRIAPALSSSPGTYDQVIAWRRLTQDGTLKTEDDDRFQDPGMKVGAAGLGDRRVERETPDVWMEHLAKLAGRRTPQLRWTIAAAALLAALGIRAVFADRLQQVPLLTLFPAVFLTALLCGWLEGLVVLAAAAIVAWFFLLGRPGAVQVVSGTPLLPLLGFLAIGIPMVAVVAALAELIRRLESAKAVHESLFEELQHRVANNMQFIAAMLQQARRGMEDNLAAEVLDQASARIASMARLNRQLSDPAAYQRGLEPVLRDLLAEVFQELPVTLILDIQAKTLSLDQMTVIVLLVSEAATNAVKHVFRPEQGTSFEVSLVQGVTQRLRLTIRDDGPGLGPMAVPHPPAQKLGMRIMQALAQQLGGSLELLEGGGAALRVEFLPR